MKEVLIKFKTEKQCEAFMDWLSGSGEQLYFEQKDYVPNAQDFCNAFIYDYENNIINGEIV